MQFVRSKKVFFLSECLVNQNIRAYGVGNVKGSGALNELISLLLEHDIGMTIVSCPEIPYEGLIRTACGRDRYENDEYRALCKKLAQPVVARYKEYLNDDYKVGGYICVNGSPSCAIDFCYSGESCPAKCLVPGIFIEEIQKELKAQNLELEFIGVRVKELDHIIEKIKAIIQSL